MRCQVEESENLRLLSQRLAVGPPDQESNSSHQRLKGLCHHTPAGIGVPFEKFETDENGTLYEYTCV